MKEAVRRSSSRRTAIVAVFGCATLALAACGEDEQFANEPNPPVPITVTALVDEDAISVSPAQVGGGVARFILANQSSEPQEVSLRARDQRDAVIAQVRQPIAVGGTGELKRDLEPGVYELVTDGDDIEPGILEVGPKRPEGEDQLLLP